MPALVAVGFLVGFGIGMEMPNSILNEYQEAIQACEISLPRDQQCQGVITAEIVSKVFID